MWLHTAATTAVVACLLLATHAHAADLPTSISSANYTSVDDTVAPGGTTTLNVQSMLVDAYAKGLTEVFFDATRTTFNNGTIAIALPEFIATWRFYRIPLRVVIRDGISGAVQPKVFIRVTGVLAQGSSIVIEGGVYEFMYTFVDLPAGITIQDGSTLAIRGGTYRLRYPVGADIGSYASLYTSLVTSSGSVTVNSTSTLGVTDNTIEVWNETAPSTWTCHIVYAKRDVDYYNVIALINVHNSSSFSVNNNSMVFKDVNAARGWEVYAVYAYIEVSLGTNGTLSVSNNKMAASNVTVSYNKWQVYNLYINGGRSTYICLLDNSSTLDVSSNDMAVSNATIWSSWERGALYITYGGGVVGLSDNSTIKVSSNTLTVLNVTMGYQILGYVSSTPGVANIFGNSAYIVANNVMSFRNVSVGVNSGAWSNMQLTTLYCGSVKLVGMSAMSVSNNTIDVHEVLVDGPVFVYDLFASTRADANRNIPLCSLDTSSTLVVMENDVAVSNCTMGSLNRYITSFVTDADVTVVYIDASYLRANSTVMIAHNTMVASELTVSSVSMYTLKKVTALQVGGNSTFTITNNSNVMTNFSTAYGGYSFYASATKGIRLSTNGTFTVSNNTVSLTNAAAYNLVLNTVTVDDLYVEEASSLLSITNNTVLVSNVTVQQIASHVLSALGASVNNFGTITVSLNDMEFSNVTALFSWAYNVVYMSTLTTGYAASIYVTSNSTFATSNNKIRAVSVMAGHIEWNAMESIISLSVLYNSSYSLDNNTMQLWDANITGALTNSIYKMDGTLYGTSLGTNSTFSATSNVISFRNISVGAKCQVSIVSTSRPLYIRGDSALSVSNNSVVVWNASVVGPWNMSVATMDNAVTMTVCESSAILFNNNNMTVSHVRAGSDCRWFTVNITASPLQLSNNGTLSVTGNAMSASNFTTQMPLTWAVLNVSGSVSTYAKYVVNVSNNKMSAVGVDVGSVSQWSVLDVGIVPNVTTTSNNISMCDVYANETLCDPSSCGAASFEDGEASTCNPPTTTTTTTSTTTANTTTTGGSPTSTQVTTTSPPPTVLVLEVNASLATLTLLHSIQVYIYPSVAFTVSCRIVDAGVSTKTCRASFMSAGDAAIIKQLVVEGKLSGVMSAAYDDITNSPTAEEDDNNTLIIIVCVVLGCILLLGGGVGLACWLRSKRSTHVGSDESEMVLNHPDDGH